jgi:hypothetical protein
MGESDGLISNVLLWNIIGHILFQTGMRAICILGARKLFNLHSSDNDVPESRLIAVLVFNLFVLMTDLYLINSRVAGDAMSVLDGLSGNRHFVVLFVSILIVHFVLSHFASVAFQTTKLPIEFSLYSRAFADFELVVGFLLKLMRIRDYPMENFGSKKLIK